jgi:hypothetical protein
MAHASNGKLYSYITIAALVLWGITLTPLAHFIISADAKPLATSFFTALMGVGPALKVMSKR